MANILTRNDEDRSGGLGSLLLLLGYGGYFDAHQVFKAFLSKVQDLSGDRKTFGEGEKCEPRQEQGPLGYSQVDGGNTGETVQSREQKTRRGVNLHMSTPALNRIDRD